MDLELTGKTALVSGRDGAAPSTPWHQAGSPPRDGTGTTTYMRERRSSWPTMRPVPLATAGLDLLVALGASARDTYELSAVSQRISRFLVEAARSTNTGKYRH